MTDLRTAAQQALEALSLALSDVDWRANSPTQPVIHKAHTALEAALAEPVQEPVAWMVYTLDGQSVCVTDNPADFTDEHRVLPLFTAPPQRKPLTEEEIDALFHDWNAHCYGSPVESHRRFARVVEAAHGIKDQG